MSITVSDPFDAIKDAEMPSLAQALDPLAAKKEFKRRLPKLSGRDGKLRLKAIRVVRYKPARRCVVEYDVQVERPRLPIQTLTLIGKIRARRFGMASFRLLEKIWDAGFQTQNPDGICVPEPIGVIAPFQMWFQRKTPGETATRLLTLTGAVKLAERIGDAIHKLHRANVPTERAHTMADELRILGQCLAKTAELHPQWAERLKRVEGACHHLAATVAAPTACGIHRDFYPAQVLVADSRLCLIDFDLYCLGDPGLDVGNFLGHMTEQALREFGDSRALTEAEHALEERFVHHAGESVRPAIRAHTTLTLVRHIFLSTQFRERQKTTKALLELCEERLAC